PSIKQSITKETIMTKAQETAADYTAQLKDGLSDLQTRAKTVYEKSTVLASEMGEFSKHNVEAIVESGKIIASGMQEMAKSYVEEGKSAVSTMTSDAKEIAAVKSPTEFVQLQSQIASRNFDATIATVSKTTEAWVKLANEAFAPISSRVSVAMDKVRKAA
ncbi:MAG: phasin family protein, partial [Allopontixanthobacter sediminis]